jgi:hypothetical protein
MQYLGKKNPNLTGSNADQRRYRVIFCILISINPTETAEYEVLICQMYNCIEFQKSSDFLTGIYESDFVPASKQQERSDARRI